MTLPTLMHIRTGRDGVMSRRSFLWRAAAGAAGAGLLGWKGTVTLHADELRRQGRACILLFMRRGPSQLETFDPKPSAPAEVRGELGSIPSRVPGLAVGELLPHSAKVMNRVTVKPSVGAGRFS